MAERTEWQKRMGIGEHGPYIARAARSTQVSHSPGIKPRVNDDNAWERGILTETRPGGYVVPVRGPDMEPISIKHYAENKHAIDSELKQLKT